MSLNPFHTGRGLSTEDGIRTFNEREGLNPFHTGRGLSTRTSYRIRARN